MQCCLITTPSRSPCPISPDEAVIDSIPKTIPRKHYIDGTAHAFRNRSALLTTVTELKLIAAAATTGLRRMPKKG